jgi:hypothetical protein
MALQGLAVGCPIAALGADLSFLFFKYPRG